MLPEFPVVRREFNSNGVTGGYGVRDSAEGGEFPIERERGSATCLALEGAKRLGA